MKINNLRITLENGSKNLCKWMATSIGILLISISTNAFAQRNLVEEHVPESARLVVSASGNNLLKLVSLREMESFTFVKKMLSKVNSREGFGAEIQSFSELGFDLNSKGVYFYEPQKNTLYNTFLFKMDNKTNLEKNLLSQEKLDSVKMVDGLNVLTKEEDIITIAAWNESLFALTVVYNAKEEKNALDFANLMKTDTVNTIDSFLVDMEKKQKIAEREKALSYVKRIFNKKFKSISENQSYQRGKDDDAAMYAWVGNYGELADGMIEIIKDELPGYDEFSKAQLTKAYGTIYAKVYFEETSIRMETSMEFNNKFGKEAMEMYDSKLDKRFFKYFDGNNALAYLTTSTNMEALWNSYPNMIKNGYAQAMPNFKEEIELGADLIEILLDEKAIGELITGDMMFVLHDLRQKEVPYTTYEYDENFESKVVTKMKKELSPDFSCMLGCENKEFLERLMRIGVKHKVVDKEANYYKINTPKSVPMDVYAVIVDGMLIISSSPEMVAGEFKSKGSKHNKFIAGSNMTIYINGKKMMDNLSGELVTESNPVLDFYQQAPIGDIKSSYSLKGNKLTSVTELQTPAGQNNSLSYFLILMDKIAGL